MLGALVAATGIVAHYRLAGRAIPARRRGAGRAVDRLCDSGARQCFVRDRSARRAAPADEQTPVALAGDCCASARAAVLALTPLINHRPARCRAKRRRQVRASVRSRRDCRRHTRQRAFAVHARGARANRASGIASEPSSGTRSAIRRAAPTSRTGCWISPLASSISSSPKRPPRTRSPTPSIGWRTGIRPSAGLFRPVCPRQVRRMKRSPTTLVSTARKVTRPRRGRMPRLSKPARRSAGRSSWTVLALLLVPAAWRRRGDPAASLALALLASALTLEASFLVISIASDLRYHLWPMAASALALILLSDRISLNNRASIVSRCTAWRWSSTGGLTARSTLPPSPDTYEAMIKAPSG